MKDNLTLEQQDVLLDDLESLLAIIMAQQEYLKSIGKLEECKEFTREFLKAPQEEGELQ